MQNNPEKNSGTFKKFLKDKGYYIVLALCVVAVGVSGYLFISTANQGREAVGEVNESLSVPLTPTTKDETSKPNSTKPATPGPSGSATETSGMTDDKTAAVSAITTVRPLSGETVGDYSMDALSFNATTQDWRTHNGIDIAATVGDNVTAARDGTVTAVYDDDAYGKTVVISHGDGYVTHYANLAAELPVGVGTSVKAGDVLGTVGESGTIELETGSHLHFTVYRNNEPMNPEAFLG